MILVDLYTAESHTFHYPRHSVFSEPVQPPGNVLHCGHGDEAICGTDLWKRMNYPRWRPLIDRQGKRCWAGNLPVDGICTRQGNSVTCSGSYRAARRCADVLVLLTRPRHHSR
jgi:hypothetical protein